jgi:N-acetylneuraminate synthase
MAREMKIGNKLVGDGCPTYVIAEIGINHNGDVDIAKQMIDAAVVRGRGRGQIPEAHPGCCTPPEQQKQMRETPWGYITYLDYRYKVEFGEEEYCEIDRIARRRASTGWSRSGTSLRWTSWNSSTRRLTNCPPLRSRTLS